MFARVVARLRTALAARGWALRPSCNTSRPHMSGDGPLLQRGVICVAAARPKRPVPGAVLRHLAASFPSVPTLPLQADLRILVYSGDVDGIVPVVGTRRWVSSLRLKVGSTSRGARIRACLPGPALSAVRARLDRSVEQVPVTCGDP
jgi:hypothetical protein